MKKQFEKPEMELVRLNDVDVIATSGRRRIDVDYEDDEYIDGGIEEL